MENCTQPVFIILKMSHQDFHKVLMSQLYNQRAQPCSQYSQPRQQHPGRLHSVSCGCQKKRLIHINEMQRKTKRCALAQTPEKCERGKCKTIYSDVLWFLKIINISSYGYQNLK